MADATLSIDLTWTCAGGADPRCHHLETTPLASDEDCLGNAAQASKSTPSAEAEIGVVETLQAAEAPISKSTNYPVQFVEDYRTFAASTAGAVEAADMWAPYRATGLKVDISVDITAQANYSEDVGLVVPTLNLSPGLHQAGVWLGVPAEADAGGRGDFVKNGRYGDHVSDVEPPLHPPGDSHSDGGNCGSCDVKDSGGVGDGSGLATSAVGRQHGSGKGGGGCSGGGSGSRGSLANLLVGWAETSIRSPRKQEDEGHNRRGRASVSGNTGQLTQDGGATDRGVAAVGAGNCFLPHKSEEELHLDNDDRDRMDRAHNRMGPPLTVEVDDGNFSDSAAPLLPTPLVNAVTDRSASLGNVGNPSAARQDQQSASCRSEWPKHGKGGGERWSMHPVVDQQVKDVHETTQIRIDPMLHHVAGRRRNRQVSNCDSNTIECPLPAARNRVNNQVTPPLPRTSVRRCPENRDYR